ncbi:MAG: O-antigen ligase family protein [Anaerolineales bacterium]
MVTLLSTPQLQRVSRFLWGLVLLTLPVTSFRYMPDFMGRTLIQPLAFYPLVALLLVLIILFWRSGGVPLPSNIRLLLAFLLFAIIGSLLGALYSALPLRGAHYEERVLRGWFSVIIGLAFFFAAFWMNRTEKDLQHSLKWIYASLGLTILWSLVQAVAVNTTLIPRNLVNQIQLIFSVRPLLQRRISGFAYESAWLADQIVIFYLPWLFAAFFKGRALLKQHWIEPLLIILSLAVLVFTYSRGGLLSAVVCILAVFVMLGRGLIQRAWRWLARPLSPPGLALRVGLLLALVVTLVATGSFLSRYQYFSNLWDLGDSDDPLGYLVDIGAGQRLAYALAGYQVYTEHPLTGVGLGASALYLLPHYPDWSITIPEVARQISPDSDLIPNTKSLYVRLLAETGLPGFWLFAVFFLSFLAISLRMHASANRFLRFVAVAGVFAWLGIALRNLTQDSFTLPIMWVALGMLVGLDPTSPNQFRLKGKP